MADSLKEKTSIALFWSFIDKGGQQLIQLAFGCILVRLLSPKEFGLIGVLFIFTVIANILQESGFSSALIRNKNADEKDYSTVFYFNIAISIFIYVILFISAPLIASFYETPLLKNLSRLIFLSFIFNAFGIIQNVHLIKRMDFKTNTQITFMAGILSGGVAIWMAYKGYGVWSLAMQQVLQTCIRSVTLWLMVKWYPSAPFVLNRLKGMSAYSIKLLLNSVFNQVASNIYSLVIGKSFSLAQVGYYTQAYKLNYIPQTVIAGSLQGVTYPLLNQIDNDPIRQKRVFRKIVRIVSFISFPVAMLTIVIAQPLIIILLTNKWIESAPILQILAVGGSVFPLYGLISSLLQSLGKSGLLLKIEFIRNIFSVLSIFITVNYGVIGLVFGLSIINVLAFTGGFYISGKCISYKLKQVMKDIFPYLTISIVSISPTYLFSYIIANNYILLFVQVITGTILYLITTKVLGSKVMEEGMQLLKRKNKK